MHMASACRVADDERTLHSLYTRRHAQVLKLNHGSDFLTRHQGRLARYIFLS